MCCCQIINCVSKTGQFWYRWAGHCSHTKWTWDDSAINMGETQTERQWDRSFWGVRLSRRSIKNKMAWTTDNAHPRESKFVTVMWPSMWPDFYTWSGLVHNKLICHRMSINYSRHEEKMDSKDHAVAVWLLPWSFSLPLIMLPTVYALFEIISSTSMLWTEW